MAYKKQPPCPRQSPEALVAILLDLPAWHGTQSDTNRSARRRWRKKMAKKAKKADEDNKAALKSKLELLYPPSIPGAHARNFTVFHVNVDQSQNQPESQSAAGPPPQDGRNRAQNDNQDLDDQQQTAAAPRRIDSFKIGDASSKPALSASSTSAEIVEALMPDRPAPVRSPRRTASLDFQYQRKIEVRDEVVTWVAEMKARGVDGMDFFMPLAKLRPG